MAITFIKDLCLLTLNTDGAIKVEGIWRRAKGYYDTDDMNCGREPHFTCPFENGYIKATYPDYTVFVVEPTDENINQTICEYNLNELSHAEYSRLEAQEKIKVAERRNNYWDNCNIFDELLAPSLWRTPR